MHYDPYETCPNDVTHQILRSRMPMHLTKCNRNFPNSTKKYCPFDASHMVDESEYHSHMSVCPAREEVTHFQRREVDVGFEEYLVKIVPHQMDVVESWELDGCNQKSYNPSEHIANRLVLRSFPLHTKSEKKNLKILERKRFQRLEAEANERLNQNKHNEKTGVKTKTNENKKHEQLKEESKDVAGHNSALQYHLEMEDSEIPLRRPYECQSSKLLSNRTNSKDDHYTSTLQPKSERYFEKVKNVVCSTSNKSTQENSQEKRHNDQKPKRLLSYAEMLHKVKEKSTEDTFSGARAQGIMSNPPATSTQLNENLFEKLTKTVKEITIEDEGYKKKTEPLNKKIVTLKKGTIAKNPTSSSTSNSTINKKYRCGAKFVSDK